MSEDSLYPILKDLAFAPRPDRTGLLATGERIGKFEILREIGRGSFGLVYEARDTELGRHVALKVLRFALAKESDEQAILARLRLEAEALARLSHPNVVTLYDFGTHGRLPFLVFEFLSGETLRGRLRRGPLPQGDALDVAVQIARGLAHAHAAAIVHRDLSPNNVFLLPDGRVKILDFGLARLREAHSAASKSPPAPAVRSETASAGTPGYMAPEQWEGQPASQRSDVFSIGVLVHEMLSGRPPFEGPKGPKAAMAADEAQALGGVRREVAAVVARALRLRPEERFDNAAAMLVALLDAQRAADGQFAPGNPYRYLDAFTEADQGCFFARERESARLRGMLSTHALVGLIGPSGAGKSSLVQAGLVPRLRREGWTILIVRPGADPLRILAEQVRRHCEGAQGLEHLAELETRPAALGAVLRDHARKRGAGVLLFIDQFEELYAHEVRPAARDAFAASLLLAADDADGPVRTILALREDQLSRLSLTAALRDEASKSLLLLGPPDAQGLVEALRGPARRLGFEFEEGLAEEIVGALTRDVPEGELATAPLPVLQLTASRLWERRETDKRVLSRVTLGGLRGVQGIIATHAEEVFQALATVEERQTAREILLALVTSERAARTEERSQLLARFARPEAAARVLEYLVRGRLLVALPARETGEERVGIAHEALVRGWGRLAEWLDEIKDERRLRDRLSGAAARWNAEGRPGEALWSGRRLREELSRAANYASPLTPAEREFLEESRSRQRRMQLQRALAVLATAALAAAIAAVAFLLYRTGEHRIAEASSSAHVSAIVAAAAGAEDPLLGALLLSELEGLPEPPGGMRAARRIAEKAIPVHLLRGHQGPVLAVAFDKSGAHLVSGSFDGTVRVWGTDGTVAPQVLRGTTAVTGLALHPDGQLIAAGFEDASVRMWRWADERAPLTLGGHRMAITQLAFSRDGTRLLSASKDGTVRVWSLGSAAPSVVLDARPGPIRAAAFDPQGARVVAVSANGTARVWRVDSARAPSVLPADGDAITTAAFSPDGEQLVAGFRDGTVRIWPARAAGAPLVLRGHRGAITSLVFDPTGTALVTTSEDGTARMWRNGVEAAILTGHSRAVRTAQFSPDGGRVLLASDDGTARIFSLGGSEGPLVLLGHGGPVTGASFSPDGALVATSSHDGTIRLWPSAGARQPEVLRLPPMQLVSDGSPAKIVDAHFARKYLLTQNTDGSVAIWRSGEAPRILGKSSGVLFDVFGSPDDSRILGVAGDGEALLWRADGPTEPLRLICGTGDVLHGSFSHDGTRMVTASRGGTACIFSSDGVGPPIVLRGHQAAVAAAVFTPDDQLVISASKDKTVRIWRADGKGESRILRGHEHTVMSIAFSPDGSRFVTASLDGTARIWPLRGSAPPLVLRGHGDHIRTALFSPDGSLIVTASADRTARVWRSDGSGEPVVLTGHDGAVLTARFSPDGTRVITNSLDRTIRLWRVDGVGEPEVFQGLDTDFSSDGSLIVTPLASGEAHVWVVGWQTLLRRLRSWTTACLAAEERARFLSESQEQARARHQECERRYHRAAISEPLAVRPPKDPAASVLEPDTDIWTANYREFDMAAPAAETCRQACIADPRCKAFSVSPPGAMGPKARCYLKDGPIDRRFKQGNVSGVVR